MRDQPCIRVIMVNFNGLEWLKKSIPALLRCTYPSLEVVVVDNGSHDGSVEYIRENFTNVTVLRNNNNRGFGIANNQGAERCPDETLLFFLNNDAILLQHDFFENLITERTAKQFDICNPLILDNAGKDPNKGKYLGVDLLGYPNVSETLFYLDGCALLIPKVIFDELGGFDPFYFMYGEDIDLSWRAHLRGVTLGICRSAHVQHYGGGSSSNTHKQGGQHIVPRFRRSEVEKNALRSLLKNYSVYSLFLVLPAYFTLLGLEVAYYIVRGEFKLAGLHMRGVEKNIRNFPETLKRRRAIQEKRKINDWHIMNLMQWKSNKLIAFSRIGNPRYN